MDNLGYIYIIKNKINKKVYIGQTQRDPELRFKDHLLVAQSYKEGKCNFRSAFYAAINKYGKENFFQEVLEKCSLEKLNEREIYWIDKYNSTDSNKGYNLTPGGYGNPNYVKSCKGRIKIINDLGDVKTIPPENLEYYKKLGYRKGNKKLSEKTKLILSNQRKGKKRSEETIHKMSLASKNKKDKYVWIHNETNETLIKKEELNIYLKEGWQLKRKKFRQEVCSHMSRPNNDGSKDFKWMKKDCINIYVHKSEIEKYTNQGYILGRYLKPRKEK